VVIQEESLQRAGTQKERCQQAEIANKMEESNLKVGTLSIFDLQVVASFSFNKPDHKRQRLNDKQLHTIESFA